jgi:ribosomal-protein-alanine N-acetyltransferase
LKEFNSGIFDNFPLLNTSRLLLREMGPADAPAIFAMRSNDSVRRYISRPLMTDIREAEELVQKVMTSYKNKEAIGWAAIHKDKWVYTGSFGYRTIDTPNLRAEIGGEMDPAFWGKGLAKEAFGEVVRFGLEHMNLHTIEAQVWPENKSAVALLEQFGFEKEGHLKECMLVNGKFADRAIYTLVNKNGGGKP